MKRLLEFTTYRCCYLMYKKQFSLPIYKNIRTWKPHLLKTHYVTINIAKSLSSIQDNSCWKCKDNSPRKNTFFCANCDSLQDVNMNLTYFNLFSMDNDFSIDNTKLNKKFRYLQSLVHPDKFGNKDKREQTNSLEWSSLINMAYKVLSEPLKRGQYILQLQRISLPEENSSLDKEFLMEMMERNEEVEDADDKNILNLRQKAQRDLTIETENLTKAFKTNDLEKAKLILVKMNYFKSLEKSIKDKAVKLGVIK